MQIPIIGPIYQHSSRDVNYQRCINLRVADAGPQGRGQDQVGVLITTPGLTSICTATGKTQVRAIINFNDSSLYCVVDATVYKVTFNEDALTATLASLGTISTSTGPVKWAINPTQIILVDGSATGYIITPSSDVLAAIADGDFTGGVTVDFLDSYFLYNTPNASTMFSTAINDGTDINALDVATAEGAPDKLVGIAVNKRELWAFGKHTTEIWYDAANATGFPLSRRDGAWIDIGCSSAYSIVKVANGLCWLDDRGLVVFADGYEPAIISTPAIGREIGSYKVISDAIGTTYIDRGHVFYEITFPTQSKTWAFDFMTKQWHERAQWTQDDEFGRHVSNCITRWKNFTLVGGYNTGKLYIQSPDYYDDAGDPIHRLRTTFHVHQEFMLLSIDALELHLEAGKGLVSGTGSDPQIMMRTSNDGGYTWSNELSRSLGTIGEYSTSVRWNHLGAAREWLFEFRFTDPIPFTLIEASADIKPSSN